MADDITAQIAQGIREAVGGPIDTISRSHELIAKAEAARAEAQRSAWRDIDSIPATKTLIATLIKWKANPGVSWAEIHKFFKDIKNTCAPWPVDRRKVVWQALLEKANIHYSPTFQFSGTDEALRLGSQWQVELLLQLQFSELPALDVHAIELPSGQLTFGQLWEAFSPLFEWVKTEMKPKVDSLAIDALAARMLSNCITLEHASMQLKDELEAVGSTAQKSLGAVASQRGHRLVPVHRPRKDQPSGKKYDGAVAATTTPQPTWLKRLATKLVAFCKPLGTPQPLLAIADSGSTVSLMRNDVYDQLSGTVARCEHDTVITSLRGATSDQPGSSDAPVIAIVEDKPIKVHLVPSLPQGIDVLLGTDALSSMGGTTITIDSNGESTVEFGTDESSASPTVMLVVPPLTEGGTDAIVEVSGAALIDSVDVDTGHARLQLHQLQSIQMAMQLASDMAAERQVALDEIEAHVAASGDDSHQVLLTVQSLRDPAQYQPETDVAPPSDAPQFKFDTATDKFDVMIDEHSAELPGRGPMPIEIKEKLKQSVRALNVKLASKDAPPAKEASFINDPDATFHLRFRPGAQVHQIYTPWRPMSAVSFAELQKQMSAWRSAGLVKPVSAGEAQVVSVPLAVPKYDSAGARHGTRIAIDLRALNATLLPDRYAPMPRTHLVRRVAANADAFSSLDGAALYMQFRIAPEDQRFFVVQSAPGRYDKLVGVPFGVSTMPGHAQLWMEQRLIAGDQDKFVYADDLVVEHVRGCSWDDVADQLLVLFERCARYNVVLNVDKFQIAVVVGVVLGFEVDCVSHTFRPNPPKMNILASMPVPRTNAQLERFLCMVSAWSTCFPGASTLVRRLRIQIKPKLPLRLDDDGAAAWQELQALLGSSVACRPFDETARAFVWTDASGEGLAWAVTQISETDPHKHDLVQAGGRRLEPFEQTKWTPELEALALREAFDKVPDLLIRNVGGTTWCTDSQAVALARDQKSQIQSRAVRTFMAELLAKNFGEIDSSLSDAASLNRTSLWLRSFMTLAFSKT